MIMIASTNPAIKGDRSKIGTGTSKRGMKPRYLLSNFAQYSALPIKTMKPQKPNKRDGNAAIKSIIDTRNFLTVPRA
jgi:hypothetical protein